MKPVLLVVDIQPSFNPPPRLVADIGGLLPHVHSVATVERHDEAVTPFRAQLGWAPGADDQCLLAADKVFIKHGYGLTPEILAYLKGLATDRILVCGVQAETCVLAAGFALFDAGLQPTLIADLVAGSSLDRSGALGVKLWRHHFGAVVEAGATWRPETEDAAGW
jgi:nicotinamidase-related amidase